MFGHASAVYQVYVRLQAEHLLECRDRTEFLGGERMIDLRSDTVTKPTDEMRKAMARADVGDDVYGEDPTVNRLQDMAANMLGKRFALFVPSGTMANQLAIRSQAQPGQEIIVESKSHIVRYEQGAAGALAGVQLHWIYGERGVMSAEQVEAAIRPNDPHSVTTALICLENTHNAGGGTIYPLSTIERIRTIAVRHRIPMHLDGARLFNAVAATTLPPTVYAQHFETVSICLSKGLGAPVGSLLLSNDQQVIDRARRFRRMYGGGMRQAGIIAAAGIYALERHITRLKTDHEHAKSSLASSNRSPRSKSCLSMWRRTSLFSTSSMSNALPPNWWPRSKITACSSIRWVETPTEQSHT